MKRFAWIGLALVGVVAFFAIGTRNIAGNPPLWWDEGWTLSVARNWVEQGHYGLLLSGQLAPPTLAAHFPVVAPIALSFRLFGVGIEQARTVGLVFTAIALALLFEVTRRVYTRTIAFATLAIVLLSPPEWYIHPVHVGRQVLGEMPSLAYLLGGYFFFLLTPRRPIAYITFASVCWAIALMSKDQVLPFWVASLMAPLALLMWKRQWPQARAIGIALISSLVFWQVLVVIKRLVLSGHTMPAAPIHGLAEVSAAVFTPSIRRAALRFTLYSMFPIVAGLAYTVGRFVLVQMQYKQVNLQMTVRLMLLTLAGTWLAWFDLLSIGWPRFVFPAVFVSAPMVAKMLSDLTHGFNPAAAARGFRASWVGRRLNSSALKTILGIAMLVMLCRKGQIEYSRYLVSVSDRSAEAVAAYLNTETPPGATVETYESELMFLLNRPYHYPPPQFNVDLIRHNWQDSNAPLPYDVHAVAADYIITGAFGKELYTPLIQDGSYRLLRTIGGYTVYQKAR